MTSPQGASVTAPGLHMWCRTDVCPFGFSGVGVEGYLDVHSQVVGRKPGPGAMERYRLARIVRHRDTNEIAIADDAAGWIEIDPTGAGRIDLGPRVRVATPIVDARDVQISRNEACGHPEGAHSHGTESRLTSALRQRKIVSPWLRSSPAGLG